MSSIKEKHRFTFHHQKLMQDRVGIILDCLSQGITDTQEIQRKLDAVHDEFYRNEYKGKGSVSNTINALKEMNNVVKIKETRRFSDEDYSGIDLFVYCRINECEIKKLGVGVKSSEGSCQKYLNSLGSTTQDIDEFLIKNKRIVIDGRKKASEIKHDFEKQLVKLFSC